MNRRADDRMLALTVAAALVVGPSAGSAQAENIDVLSVTATGLMKAFETIGREFERATGHRLTIDDDLAGGGS